MIDITYDRKERLYKWIDPESGEVLTAPAGAKNKAQLFQAAVGLLDPDLYAVATRLLANHPQLERVTWKAVAIVCNGGVDVFAVPQGSVQAMVASSDGYGRYAVSSDNGYYVCQCEHWQSLSAPLTRQGRRYCKHILAMYLWRVTRENRF